MGPSSSTRISIGCGLLTVSFKVVKDEDKGFEAFFDGLRGLSGKRVKVGIQGAEATQVAGAVEAGRGGAFTGGITMVELGTIHEFGAIVKNGWGKGIKIVIPQRSFLRSTADMNQKKYETRLTGIVRKLFRKPKQFSAEGELLKVGETMRRDVINRMRKGEIPPPLAESTKRSRGEDGPPLVDTGMLMGSIRAVVI